MDMARVGARARSWWSWLGLRPRLEIGGYGLG